MLDLLLRQWKKQSGLSWKNFPNGNKTDTHIKRLIENILRNFRVNTKPGNLPDYLIN